MSLEGLEKTVIGTALGPIPLWAPPGSLQGERPVVLTITGSWAKHDTMSLTPKIVGPWGWDAVLMHLPGNDTPELAETSVAAWARAVEELLEQANWKLQQVGGGGASTALAV